MMQTDTVWIPSGYVTDIPASSLQSSYYFVVNTRNNHNLLGTRTIIFYDN